MHASAVRVLFSTISLQDDARVFTPEESASKAGAAYPVLCNPARYASTVKTLAIADPALPDNPALLPEDVMRPIDAEHLASLLDICANMEAFVWESAFPPPDGLAEVCVALL